MRHPSISNTKGPLPHSSRVGLGSRQLQPLRADMVLGEGSQLLTSFTAPLSTGKHFCSSRRGLGMVMAEEALALDVFSR